MVKPNGDDVSLLQICMLCPDTLPVPERAEAADSPQADSLSGTLGSALGGGELINTDTQV